MRVMHVAATAYPARSYGGPVQSVFEALRALAETGLTVSLVTTDADGKERLPGACAEWGDVAVEYCRAAPLNSYGWSAQLIGAIARRVADVDVVHCHGLFLPSTTFGAWFGRRARKPVFVSPHGACMRWARSQKSVRKRLYGLIDLYGFSRAVWHATSAEEAEHIADLVDPDRVVIVPNGVDVAYYREPFASRGFRVRHGVPGDAPMVAWVGRFDPVKNVEVLVEATRGLGVELVLAGDADTGYGRKVREAAGGRRDVHFVGYLDAAGKRALLREASVYAHPSIMESYGMSIAEALASSCPVVASEGTPWKDLAEQGAGLRVPASAESFRDALRSVLQRGRSGYVAGTARFADANSWPARARQLRAAYELHAGAAR